MSSWLEPQTTRLHQLIIDPIHHSASQIALLLNKEFKLALTRNSIIGKIHRMGWAKERAEHPKRAQQQRPRVRAKPRGGVTAFNNFNVKKAEPPSPVPPTPLPDLRISLPQRRSISQLENGFCRYPVGEPGEANFFYCGGRTKGDRVYCRKHWAIAHRPVVRR